MNNEVYLESVEFLKKHRGFGGDRIPGESFDSLDRFVRLATCLQEFSQSGRIAEASSAFDILADVADFEEAADEAPLEFKARWNIVYNLSTRTIHFLTRSHKKIRTISLDAFDFGGHTKAKVLDMQAKLAGDVSHEFIPYTYELNRDLIDRYYGQVPFLKDISEEIREATARYPEKTFYVAPE